MSFCFLTIIFKRYGYKWEKYILIMKKEKKNKIKSIVMLEMNV